MTLITEQYRQLNKQLHQSGVGYGMGGHRWADKVARLAQEWNCQTMVDYGAGGGTLSQALRRISPVQVVNYDPAVPEYEALPAPADLVTCTDMLEHCEPTCLITVIDHIRELANVGAFFNIATRPAKKVLADGRNAHLMVRNAYFWLDTLREFFDVIDMDARPGEVNFICKRLGTFYTD